MQLSSIPAKIAAIFAASAPTGYKNTIPLTQAEITQPGQASFDVGFPSVTMQPASAGGINPYGQDFNGLGYALTAPMQWLCASGNFPYDSAFSTSIGGYPKGALLLNATGDGFWINIADNNTSNPDSGGSNWIAWSPAAIQSNLASSCIAAGTADALTGAFKPTITALPAAGAGVLTLSVRAATANATTTPTFKADGTPAKTIVKGANTALVPGDIAGTGHWLELQYDATLDKWVLLNPATGVSSSSFFARSYLAGLTLSTAGSSSTFSVAAGIAADNASGVMITLAAAISKTTSSWSAGNSNGALDTGTIANNTWYHAFVIRNPTSSVVDVLVSTSATAPTLPTGYTQFRRIGSMKTNGSAQWLKFVQDGDLFQWDTPTNDVTATNPGLSQVLRTLNTPLGVSVEAIVNSGLSATTNGVLLLLTDPSTNDVAPSLAASGGSLYAPPSTGGAAQSRVRTNTSSQVRSRLSNSDAGTVLYITTTGWKDTRGKDN